MSCSNCRDKWSLTLVETTNTVAVDETVTELKDFRHWSTIAVVVLAVGDKSFMSSDSKHCYRCWSSSSTVILRRTAGISPLVANK